MPSQGRLSRDLRQRLRLDESLEACFRLHRTVTDFKRSLWKRLHGESRAERVSLKWTPAENARFLVCVCEKLFGSKDCVPSLVGEKALQPRDHDVSCVIKGEFFSVLVKNQEPCRQNAIGPELVGERQCKPARLIHGGGLSQSFEQFTRCVPSFLLIVAVAFVAILFIPTITLRGRGPGAAEAGADLSPTVAPTDAAGAKAVGRGEAV